MRFFEINYEDGEGYIIKTSRTIKEFKTLFDGLNHKASVIHEIDNQDLRNTKEV